MLSYLACLLLLITMMIAMPLNSKIFPSTSRNRCSGKLALLEDEHKLKVPEDDAIEMPLGRDVIQPTDTSYNRFTMKRLKLDSCKPREVQPAVRLSAFPNSGSTWIQYLLEEATKVATQSAQNIIKRNGGTTLLPNQEVTCRAECGAQNYLHRNCTAGSVDAVGVVLATGATPEIFKNHYPDLTTQAALFETYNVMQKTILLARNPVDAYLAAKRHTSIHSADKVGATPDTFPEISNNCATGYTSMRRETKGRGIDPLHTFEKPIVQVSGFEQFILVWCNFFTYWLTHSSAMCTEVTLVRYEDLATTTEDVLETILQEAGHSTEGINRSVTAYPADENRLSYDVYFNNTLHANSTIKKWADIAVRKCGNYVNDFGYMPLLQSILEH